MKDTDEAVGEREEGELGRDRKMGNDSQTQGNGIELALIVTHSEDLHRKVHSRGQAVGGEEWLFDCRPANDEVLNVPQGLQLFGSIDGRQ